MQKFDFTIEPKIFTRDEVYDKEPFLKSVGFNKFNYGFVYNRPDTGMDGYKLI